MSCPVCEFKICRLFFKDGDLVYHHCDQCEAVFLDARLLPSPEEELSRYSLHRNLPDDPDYRRFLGRTATPLLKRLAPGSRGLDFGCGPGPALAAMLREAGHQVNLYDPFFAPDASVLDQEYDFLTCTETAEHFHFPAREFKLLGRMLRSGGTLVIQTSFLTDDIDFKNWHYRRDPTHVVFYREATMKWLAGHHGWRCHIREPDVVLFRSYRVNTQPPEEEEDGTIPPKPPADERINP